EVVSHESRLEDQVLRGVAGEGQLRKADDVDVLLAGAVDPLRDQARVAGQVADGRVDLGQPDSKRSVHEFILTSAATRGRIRPAARIWVANELLRSPARARQGPAHAPVRGPRPRP